MYLKGIALFQFVSFCVILLYYYSSDACMFFFVFFFQKVLKKLIGHEYITYTLQI